MPELRHPRRLAAVRPDPRSAMAKASGARPFKPYVWRGVPDPLTESFRKLLDLITAECERAGWALLNRTVTILARISDERRRYRNARRFKNWKPPPQPPGTGQ